MGTKNNPDEFDCYDRILPDEPFFTLRAADPEAPAAVRSWATSMTRRLDRGQLARGQDPYIIARKIARAFDCANEMEKWRIIPIVYRTPPRPKRERTLVELEMEVILPYLKSIKPRLKTFNGWNSRRRGLRFRGNLKNIYSRLSRGDAPTQDQLILLANFHSHYVKFAQAKRVKVPDFPRSVYERADCHGDPKIHRLV